MLCWNLYKLPDSLANPANAILSSMDGQRPLADVANTKAAAVAHSPMPPPPATPGTSGKKRKRSAATLARDKLVSSKKYQTYKLYEELQASEILNDPSELDKLKEYIQKNNILVISGYNKFKNTELTEIRALQESLAAREEEYKREIKRYQDKETERRLERAQILAKFEAPRITWRIFFILQVPHLGALPTPRPDSTGCCCCCASFSGHR